MKAVQLGSISDEYDYLSVCVVCGMRARLQCRVCREEGYCSPACRDMARVTLKHRYACGDFESSMKGAIGRLRAVSLMKAAAEVEAAVNNNAKCRLCGQHSAPNVPLYWSGCSCRYYAHVKCFLEAAREPGGRCPTCDLSFTGMAGAIVKFNAWFADEVDEAARQPDIALAKLLAHANEAMALRVARRLFEDARRKYGETHAEFGRSLDNIADISILLRNTGEAVRAYRALLSWRRRQYGPADRGTYNLTSKVGTTFLVFAETQRKEEDSIALSRESADLFLESIARQAHVKGLTHEDTLPTIISLGRALAQANDYSHAHAVVDCMMPTFLHFLGPKHHLTLRLQSLRRAIRRLAGDVATSTRRQVGETTAPPSNDEWPLTCDANANADESMTATTANDTGNNDDKPMTTADCGIPTKDTVH